MNPEEKTSPVKENSPLHALRTYAGDVEESLAKNKTSLTSIVIDEQKRREKNPEDVQKQQTTNKFFVVLGGTFLLVGIVVLWAVYYTRSQIPVVAVEKIKTLIAFSEEKKIILGNATRDQVLGKLITEKQSFKLPVNSVLYINMVNASNTPVQVSEILSLLAPRMPSALSRSFDSKYMLGVYSFDINTPFILLSTSDYATSFAGMLSWEEEMTNDIGAWFGVFGTSTPKFQDEELRNKDLRVFKNENGNTILLYSFLDKDTLLITGNENIFSAILGKYLIQKAIP